MRNLTNYVENNIMELKRAIQVIDDFQKRAPEGRLRLHIRKNFVCYRHELKQNDGSLTCGYISANNKSLITTLAQKTYYAAVRKSLCDELKAHENFLAKYKPLEKDDVFDALSTARKDLVRPVFVTPQLVCEKYILRAVSAGANVAGGIAGAGAGANVAGGIAGAGARKATNKSTLNYLRTADFKKMIASLQTPGNVDFHPENLIHASKRGEKLRSKAEVDIANELFAHSDELLYFYELPIYIAALNKYFYPDFTIINLRTGEIWFWEHLGVMDNPEYASNSIYKINMYATEGIVLGKNLLLTMETKNQPLDYRLIQNNINIMLGK